MLRAIHSYTRSADVSSHYLPWAYFDGRFVPVAEAREVLTYERDRELLDLLAT